MTGTEPTREPLSVVHIINSLDPGGAELTLLRLLSELQDSGISSSVVALTGDCGLRPEFEAIGVPVTEIKLKRSITGLLRLRQLHQILRAQRPQVVQTWLYHSDLLGGLMAYWARVPRIYWNIRHSDPLHPESRFSTRLVARINAWLSHRVPTGIVYCAREAAQQHLHLGYSKRHMLVIENGFDTERFKPNPAAAQQLRQRLAVPADTPLIGLIARFHPYKGHVVFVDAARIHLQTNPNTRFVLCGPGITRENTRLTQQISDAGISAQCHLLGEQSAIETIQAGLSIACSASLDEGFSNALGEAMACGVPCVATDVGASDDLLGDTGWIVAPGNSAELAAAWSSALQEPQQTYGNRSEAARERILQHYSLQKMGVRYAELYRDTNQATPNQDSGDPM